MHFTVNTSDFVWRKCLEREKITLDSYQELTLIRWEGVGRIARGYTGVDNLIDVGEVL